MGKQCLKLHRYLSTNDLPPPFSKFNNIVIKRFALQRFSQALQSGILTCQIEFN